MGVDVRMRLGLSIFVGSYVYMYFSKLSSNHDMDLQATKNIHKLDPSWNNGVIKSSCAHRQKVSTSSVHHDNKTRLHRVIQC